MQENGLAAEVISIDGSYLLGSWTVQRGLNMLEMITFPTFRTCITRLRFRLFETYHDARKTSAKNVANRYRELTIRAIGSLLYFAKDYGITVCVEDTPFHLDFSTLRPKCEIY